MAMKYSSVSNFNFLQFNKFNSLEIYDLLATTNILLEFLRNFEVENFNLVPPVISYGNIYQILFISATETIFIANLL